MTLVLPPRPTSPEPLDVDPSALRSLAQAFATAADTVDSAHAQGVAAVESVMWTGPTADLRARVVTSAAVDLARTGSACRRAQDVLHRAAGAAQDACVAVESARRSVSRLQSDHDRLVVAARAKPEDATTEIQALHEVAQHAERAHAQAREEVSRLDAATRLAEASAAEVGLVFTSVGQVHASPPPAPVVPSRPKHLWAKAADAVAGAVDSTVRGVGHAAAGAWDFTESLAQYYAENPAEAVKTAADAVALAGGAYLIAAGATGEVGGVVLDVTGVGAVIGVPINVAAAGVIAAGAGASIYGSHGLQDDLRTAMSGMDRGGRGLSSDHGYVPAPKGTLRGFPDAKQATPKTPRQGGGGLRKRWRDKDGSILEWDSQHGRVEKYDKTGKRHLGEFDPDTGEQITEGKPGRTVEK